VSKPKAFRLSHRRLLWVLVFLLSFGLVNENLVIPAQAAAGPQAQNVTVSAVSDTMLKVTWDAPTLSGETIDRYTVKYRPNAGGSYVSEPARLSTSPRRELITGLDANTTYDVVVVTSFTDAGVEASESNVTTGTTDSPACTLPGARSGFSLATPSALFLGGNYIELGISQLGNFGTSQNFPAGFFGAGGRSTIGMSADFDGFNCGENLSIDYFLPGSPEERWAIGYSQGGTDYYLGVSRRGGVGRSGLAAMTATDTVISNLSSGENLKASVVSTVRDSSNNPVMRISQVISFGEDDLYFTNTVTVTNLSGSPFDKARFMRSFDPDNTVDRGGSFDTENEVISSFGAGDSKEVVRAQLTDSQFASTKSIPSTYDTRAPILFYSSDPDARASRWGFSNSNVWDSRAYDSPITSRGVADEAITIAFEVASLASNASDTFLYVTSLDQRDFDLIEAEIAQLVQETEEAATPAASSGTSRRSSDDDEEEEVVPASTPTPVVTPRVPTTPRPTPPVLQSGPVLTRGVVPSPPKAPTLLLGGRPTVISTTVPTTTRLDVTAGRLALGVKVLEDQGTISEAPDGTTEISVRKGASATVSGSGFRPGATVQVFMPLAGDNAKELTRIPVNPDGSFDGSAPFATRPNEAPLPIGKNVLQLVSLDNDGNQVVVEMAVNIAQGAPAPEQNRIEGVIPAMTPGQSIATSGGEPVSVTVTPVSDQKLAVVEGDGWTMAINVASENGGVEPSEGGALLKLVRNDTTVVSGSGFMPGTRADVWLFSDPTLLGTVTIDENGEFNGEFNVDPNMVPVGEHTLQLQGVGEDGYVKAANLGVMVDDPVEAMPTTVETGWGFIWWIVTAVVLLALIIVLLTARRRREQN